MKNTERKLVDELDTKLRQLRITNLQIGRITGYTPLQIGKWRNGKQTMKLSVFFKLCEIAKISSITIDNITFKI